jgi:hypothetical protein
MYIDETEVFRVKQVRYIRAMNKKVPIYQLDVETAPFKKSTLDELMAHQMTKHYFFFQDTGGWIESKDYPYFNYLKNKKSEYRDLFNDIYCIVDATFNVCNFDSSIKILQRNYNFPNPYPIAKIYKDYDISDLMISFDMFYKILNRNPILNSTLFKDGSTIDGADGEVTFKEFNALEEVSDNSDAADTTINETIEVSYKDTICNSYCVNSENYGKEIEIFKIIKNEDGSYTANISDYFKYYDELYKLFYCYRVLDPQFYNKTSIQKDTYNIIENNEFFYNLQALSKVTYEQMYDPGYYISYEGGAVYFENGVGITQ